MKNLILFSLILLFLSTLLSCSPKKSEFSPQQYEKHIATLASDEFQGRMPFSEGEKKTLDYLQNEFKAIGIEPGKGTSYLQEVPMVDHRDRRSGNDRQEGQEGNPLQRKR